MVAEWLTLQSKPERHRAIAQKRPRAEGASIVHLAVDGHLAGLPSVPDPIKATTREALATLKGTGMRVVMATGDARPPPKRSRDLERQFLVSGDALARLEDLEGFALEDLGLQQLRGRVAATQVYAVTAKPSTAI